MREYLARLSKKIKKTYVFTDNFGKKHKLRISDVSCVPYAIVDTGIRSLRVQNLKKLMYFEQYKDMKICSKSIICKCDKSILYKSLSQDDIYKIAISGKELKKIIDKYEE